MDFFIHMLIPSTCELRMIMCTLKCLHKHSCLCRMEIQNFSFYVVPRRPRRRRRHTILADGREVSESESDTDASSVCPSFLLEEILCCTSSSDFVSSKQVSSDAGRRYQDSGLAPVLLETSPPTPPMTRSRSRSRSKSATRTSVIVRKSVSLFS